MTRYPELSYVLLAWFDEHGRKNLPWQHPKDAYRIWISEIMLQQTQVKTVIAYFLRFIERFPDIESLAAASEEDVLSLWSGLGYYSRARNLHKTAQIILQSHQGIMPSDVNLLQTLPGIGESTAAAIASLAYNKPTAILDGNVKRVLSRYFMIEGQSSKAYVKKILWQQARDCMVADRCGDYTQALMDFGATCCTLNKPLCTSCPVQTTCLAYQHQAVADFPQKNIKKIRPIKAQQLLVLHTDDGRIYLEKRPPTGIWGGLWCFPAIDNTVCATTYIHQTYQWSCKQPHLLLEIKHAFTHFQLHIKALLVQITASSQLLVQSPGCFFHAEELHNLGLPKPVKDIIVSCQNRRVIAKF